MEIAARQLAQGDIGIQPRGMGGIVDVEEEECSRRCWSVAWWGMRGAFYENLRGMICLLPFPTTGHYSPAHSSRTKLSADRG